MPPPAQSSEQQENEQRSGQEDGELKENPQEESQSSEKEGEPEGGKPDQSPGKQDRNSLPPPKDPENPNHPDVSGRWGVLPPKIQDDILNFNIENFPQKYRKWLEEYYKRINRQKDG